ncbi:hypothetical protein COL5a_008087 [Colletotrichum fioriniae]|nr:hypothetical protein COL5a_008087 [Colletotrichum fioriniae]
MQERIAVGIIGATGQTGRSVVTGLILSETPFVPSGRSDHAHSKYIDHRIVGDGDKRFAISDLNDIGIYVARIISDPRTLNKHVLAYSEILSMNEIWDTMAQASGETPERGNVSETKLNEIVTTCKQKLNATSETAHHPSNIMHTANYNMGQYRISWCLRGDNTPGYVEYLGGIDFWKLFPTSQKGKSLRTFFQEILNKSS